MHDGAEGKAGVCAERLAFDTDRAVTLQAALFQFSQDMIDHRKVFGANIVQCVELCLQCIQWY
jgi:hypothetical protein